MQSPHKPGVKVGKKAIDFIREIDFDEGMRFLVGRGDKEIVILNTRKVSLEPKFYKLDDIKYERIMTVRLRSESDEQYECHIACKSTAMKQIVVFDIVEEEKSKQPDEKY